jgi:Glutamine amidotransferase domain
MCGIAGMYAYHYAANPVEHAEMQRIRDHMAARGLVGLGEWYSRDERVGLGHRRPTIVDLSERGAQPMASADGKLVVTFDGEIYNYIPAIVRVARGSWGKFRTQLTRRSCCKARILVSADHGNARSHGFEKHDPETLASARHDEDVPRC